MSGRVWHITGWRHDQLIFRRQVPVSRLSEAEVRILLERLYATTISHGEIFRGSLRRNHPDYHPAFTIKRGLHPQLSIEGSTCFEAKAIDFDDIGQAEAIG